MEQLTMKMGVLSNNQLLTYDYRSKQYGRHEIAANEIWTLGQLLEGAHYHGIDTLWVVPNSPVSQIANRLLVVKPDGEFKVIRSTRPDGMPRFALIYRRTGNTKSVKIGFPEWDNRWPWQHTTDPDTLFRSILYLQDALQHEIAWSPGHTGQEILVELNQKRPEWLASVELPDVFMRNLPTDMRWKKPLTGQEARPGMWLHLFDGNSKYLGACTGANIGEGEPEHFVWVLDVELGPLHGITFNPKWPGMWRIGARWVWTPQLEYEFACLDDHNQPRPLIVEACVWQKYHETLRTFGEHMWNARLKLKSLGDTHDVLEVVDESPIDMQALALAYEAFKPIYQQGLGWLGMPGKQKDNQLFRPDAWAQVVATCYRSMGFKVRQLEKLGMRVVYVNVDTIGVISASEDLSPYEKIMLTRQSQLGGFRHYGSLPITIDLAGTFEENIKFRDCQNLINDSLKCAKEALV
jgi:hypothetical protein